MKVQLASTTFNLNVSENLYYDSIDRGSSSSRIRPFSLHKGLKIFSKKVYNEAYVKIFYGGGL